jgi:hypothetical protein
MGILFWFSFVSRLVCIIMLVYTGVGSDNRSFFLFAALFILFAVWDLEKFLNKKRQNKNVISDRK